MSDKKEELEQIRKSMKVFREKEVELMQELGEGGGGVAVEVEEREKLAEVYDKMLPGEKTKLYLENRGYFDRLLKAVEERGIQKLLHRR